LGSDERGEIRYLGLEWNMLFVCANVWCTWETNTYKILFFQRMFLLKLQFFSREYLIQLERVWHVPGKKRVEFRYCIQSFRANFSTMNFVTISTDLILSVNFPFKWTKPLQLMYVYKITKLIQISIFRNHSDFPLCKIILGTFFYRLLNHKMTFLVCISSCDKHAFKLKRNVNACQILKRNICCPLQICGNIKYAEWIWKKHSENKFYYLFVLFAYSSTLRCIPCSWTQCLSAKIYTLWSLLIQWFTHFKPKEY
jgi:hypothetical protein